MSKAQKKQSTLLSGLNPAQVEAVEHTNGPLLIIAGAGTGKTTVITRKIAYLIEQKLAEPENILALTFTDKAAAEMDERVDRLLPYGYVDVSISTFHSFCEKVLRDYGLDIGLPADFKVLGTAEQWLLIRQNLEKFDLDYYRPLGNPTKFISALVQHFSRLKDENITPDEYLKFAEGKGLNLDSAEFVEGKDDVAQEAKRLLEVARAYHTYQKLLFDNNALDFGDIIQQTLRLFTERPNILRRFQQKYKYILVDEFQDTNYAQYELIKMIAKPDNNLTVVGDDDQSIYKFRGASFSNILKFKDDYKDARHVFLTENYRSRQNILDAAYKFIQANNPDRLEIQLTNDNNDDKKRINKKLVSKKGKKGAIEHLKFADQYAEADAVIDKILVLMTTPLNPPLARGEMGGSTQTLTYNDFAILGRSHDTLIPILEKLEEKGLPYIYFANKGLYRKSIILDVLAYFKLLDNYHENQALYRVLNLAVFNIKPSAIIELNHHARKKSLSLFETLSNLSDVQNVDSDSAKGIAKLLQFLDKHTKLAAEKSAHQVFVQVFNDLEIFKAIGEDSAAQSKNAKFIQSLNNKIKNFVALSPDKSIKAFVNQVAFEMEAGETGELQSDLEAGPEAVKVMTVHAGKGLEFEHVFVVGLVDKRFPSIERRDPIEIPDELIRDILPKGDAHLQEERRLLYVAMTRAKRGLYFSRALDYGGKFTKKPSRFLIELGLAEEEKSLPTGETNFEVRRPVFIMPLPKSFSFSQISSFKKCPLEYKYRYVLGLPETGAAPLSFGQTMHKVFEQYLWMYRQQSNSQDLFGKKNGELPPLVLLEKLYGEYWIGDWYENKRQMEEYRAAGLGMLRNFYDEVSLAKPNIEFLEEPFELKVGKYKFVGKIDRADQTKDGLVVIDYKTGAPRTLAKVDKEQLLIYQWAAEDFFKDKVAKLEYWFLRDGLSKLAFLGERHEITSLQEELKNTIDSIVACIKNDNFSKIDFRVSHECEYRDLEKASRGIKFPENYVIGPKTL